MTRLCRTLIAAAAGAALLILIQPLATATTVVALSDADLVHGAKTIVHADVLEKHSVQLQGSGRIYTEYRFHVKDLLKGAAAGDGTVVFREWGGEVNGVHYWIPGVNGYEPGEEVVTFLGEQDARTGVGFTFGLAQGKFRVERAEGGKVRLTRRLGSLEVVPQGAPLAPIAPPGAAGKPPAAEPERELDTFKAFIRAEVRK
jgi:hypothetical protein